MSWDGMFRKFGSKGKVANTYPTTNDTVKAEPATDELKAENKRLTAKVEELFEDLKHVNNLLQESHNKGYADALKKVVEVIESRDGRSGKKQILSDVEILLRTHEEKH